MKPAVCAVGYNRLDSLKRLLKSLERANYEISDVTLIISIDFSGDNVVGEYAEQFIWSHGPKIVRRFKENQGLKKHIMSCLDYSIEYGAVVLFEDDIVASPYYYDYVIKAIDRYKEEKRIFGFALYAQRWNGYVNRYFIPYHDGSDTFLQQNVCSWGECILGDRWSEFRKWYKQKEGNITPRSDIPQVVNQWKESRGKYMLHYIMEKDLYYLVPYVSLSTNFNHSGIHVKRQSNELQEPLLMGRKKYSFKNFEDMRRYDCCFESIDLKKYLQQKLEDSVCVDFYGLKENRGNSRYVLAARQLPYKSIKSYGLQMRPMEQNIFDNIEGDELVIYDTKEPIRIKKDRKYHFAIIKYDVRLLGWVDALFYFLWDRIVLRKEK